MPGSQHPPRQSWLVPTCLLACLTPKFRTSPKGLSYILGEGRIQHLGRVFLCSSTGAWLGWRRMPGAMRRPHGLCVRSVNYFFFSL